MLEWLSQNAAWFVIVQFAMVIGLGVWVWQLKSQWAKRDTFREHVLQGLDEQGVDGVLSKHERDLARLTTDAKELYELCEKLQHGLSLSLTHVAVLRFNPFGDDGGNQSFAIALLNEVGTGLVVSSLHHRSGARTYAKPVKGGSSEFPLSAEEKQVVEMALKDPIRFDPRKTVASSPHLVKEPV